jgi:hypothetical protein
MVRRKRRRGTRKNRLKPLGKAMRTAIGALVAAIGLLVAVLSLDATQRFATITFTSEIHSSTDSELMVRALLDAANPNSFYATWPGSRIRLNVTIYPGGGREWSTTARPGNKPPFVLLPSSQCPNAGGAVTNFRLFVNGATVGPDDFGNLGQAAVLRGQFRVKPVTATQLGPRKLDPSCHIDLDLID